MRRTRADLYPEYLDNMWEISVNDQIFTFLLSILLGAMLCLLYDILRALRKAGWNSFVAVLAGDLLFWIVSAFAVYIFLLARTNGQVRGYVLFALVAGFALCRISLSRIFFKVLVFLLIPLFKFLEQMRVYVYVVCDRFDTYLTDFMAFFAKKLHNGLKSVKKGLKNAGGLLYTKQTGCGSSKNSDSERVLDEF